MHYEGTAILLLHRYTFGNASVTALTGFEGVATFVTAFFTHVWSQS
jgi:hypothetical protein